MAYPLISPGVDVSVIDESFYASTGEGTIPLIVIGTHEYKLHPSGEGIASGTLPEQANKLHLITSQRELIQTFGNPVFYSSQGTSRHGYELNEYGLHAAYQYLAVANRAYVIRGALDYAQLFPRATEPRGEPLNGTYWLDTSATKWGLHVGTASNHPASAWTPKEAIVIDEVAETEYRIIGSAEFDAPTDVAIGTSGALVINGVAVALVNGDTLADVVTKIQTNVDLPYVTAGIFQISGKSRLMIRSTTGKVGITIGVATAPAILVALGLNGGQEAAYTPNSMIGNDGDIAIVLTDTNANELFQKVTPGGVGVSVNDPLASSVWFKIGSELWKLAKPTRVRGSNLGPSPLPNLDGKTLVLNVSNDPLSAITVVFRAGSTVTTAVDDINFAIANASSDQQPTADALQAYEDNGSLIIVNRMGGDILMDSTAQAAKILGLRSMFGARLVFDSHNHLPYRTDETGTRRVAEGEVWVNTTQYNNGAQWVVRLFNATNGTWATVPAPLLPSDAAADALFGTSKAIGTIYVRYNLAGTANPEATHSIRYWRGFTWEDLVYNYGPIAPTTMPEHGTLWFNENFQVDIMVGDGDEWKNYRDLPENFMTDPSGVILSGSVPLTQISGQPLQNNDLWLDTSDLENYPKLFRFNANTRTWERINNADNSSPFGIVFADARKDPNSPLDPDAPDPRQYPYGMLLFNMRYSTYNVKEWHPSWLSGEYGGTDYTAESYNVGIAEFPPLQDGGRWVTVSGLAADGSPNMGRKAQRAMIVRSLASVLTSNEAIRAETVHFNLMAAPGYPELIDEMVELNTAKKEVAFIVGDSPIRLRPTGTAIQTWANAELSGAVSNGEQGLLTSNPYVGVYYPWGLSTNVDGFEVMIPPSTMALRTIAYSDSVSYPWFAPAGFTRGLVTNAVSVGYLNSENEYVAVILNEGQRDTLYSNNINPIAFMPNRGLVVFGQKTRHNIASALDRINVARLINYMRYNLDNLAKPFLFEPNDQHTRDGIRISFERFMSNLVSLRGVYDYLIVCDESNNTPDRIDRNELWVDVAIQPTKAVEFIYIPIRIVNTGDDMAAIYEPRNTYA